MPRPTRQIALIAVFSLGCALALAEPPLHSQEDRPAFLDSFGLHTPQKPAKLRKQVSPTPPPARTQPAADSFGLNGALVSATEACAADRGRMPADAERNGQKCIEI